MIRIVSRLCSPLNLALLHNGVVWLKYNQWRMMKTACSTETQTLRVFKEVDDARHGRPDCVLQSKPAVYRLNTARDIQVVEAL